jgi:hypothetical protein
MYKSMKLQGFINFDSNLTNRGKIDMKNIQDVWATRFHADNSPRKPDLIYRKKPARISIFNVVLVSLMMCALGFLAAVK